MGNWWSVSVQFFNDGGFFMWPLLACAVVGLFIIVWKFMSLTSTSSKTHQLLQDVDALIANHRLEEAKARCRESDTPVAQILLAGLEKHDEGTERVLSAIENEGMIQMSRLEQGLVWLATIANVAPLLGFLGTVAGMIIAFGAIELAGEVDATLVAGGIKVALITTAAGLTIAIPVNVAHNYFVSKIDGLVIEMEETSQNLVETLHDIERKPAAAPAPAQRA
ncbi:MAG TPA: MotA/TolQ/ExbB proton channel family protein [Gemmatimonadota bacterium]|nr:MotA/TolQ/ExbB proton channel family protein [Gemmatimonadota bacterium]